MVEPAGNATGVEVPAEVVDALGSGRRPKVVITIGGHTWRSRVASMGGRFIVGISAANRAASGISEGDVTEVDLQLDDEPRVAAEPPDLAAALDQDLRARAAFDQLPYGLKNKHVRENCDALPRERCPAADRHRAGRDGDGGGGRDVSGRRRGRGNREISDGAGLNASTGIAPAPRPLAGRSPPMPTPTTRMTS